nr:MAG TPA: hypothetical protein [Caudoviricetes sp.]
MVSLLLWRDTTTFLMLMGSMKIFLNSLDVKMGK